MTERGRPQEYFEQRIRTAVRLPKDLYKDLKHAAIDRECSVNSIVEKAVTQWLKRNS